LALGRDGLTVHDLVVADVAVLRGKRLNRFLQLLLLRLRLEVMLLVNPITLLDLLKLVLGLLNLLE